MADMSIEEIFKKINNILKDPPSYIKNQNLHNTKKYYGYNCIFCPEEILHAAGFVPIRLFGYSRRICQRKEYLPSQCCEYAKSLINSFDAGVFDFLEGVIIDFCCDTMQASSVVLQANNLADIYYIYIPIVFENKIGLKYVEIEIQKLKNHLEKKYLKKIRAVQMKKSIEIYKQNKLLLNKIKEMRSNNTDLLAFSDFLNIVMCGFFLQKEEHNMMLKDFITFLSARGEKKQNNTKVRLLVSGFINYNVELIRYIENLNTVIIDDDLCECSRYIEGETKKYWNPLKAISYSIFKHYCPAKNQTHDEYIEILLKKYKKHDADGIIFLFFTFCDPHYMEYAIVVKKLEELNIPVLQIESVVSGNNFSQLETRIEAFIERIQMTNGKQK